MSEPGGSQTKRSVAYSLVVELGSDRSLNARIGCKVDGSGSLAVEGNDGT